MDERGWSYAELARRTGDRISKARFGQIGRGRRLREFPEPATLVALADALEYDATTVVLAVARSLGLDVRRRGPDLAHLLPAGTDRLSPAVRDALLAVIRAVVAETEACGEGGASDPFGGADLTIEWAERDAPNGRNAAQRRADTDR